MVRPKRHSRRQIVIILMMLFALGFIILDHAGAFSSRVRSVAENVVAPAQGLLKGATLSLVGHHGGNPADGDAALVSDQNREFLRYAEMQNVALAAENADLQRQIDDLSRINRGLAGYPLTLVPAGVLASDYVLPDASLKIDAGSKHGVGKGQWVAYRFIAQGEAAGLKNGQPVITPQGIAGVVEKVVGPYVSQVKLVTSTECQLPARIMHWDAGGHRWLAGPDVGLTKGAGDGKTLQLRLIPATAQVAAGDYVVTASNETGSPECLIIGRVTDATVRGTPRTILVAPQANLELLDRVYVLAPGRLPPK